MINFEVLRDIGMGKLIDEKTPESRFKRASDLQKQGINESTKFLYYVKRGLDGFTSGWIWSNNRSDLVDFLTDNLIAKQIVLEESLEENNSDGFPVHNLQEAFLYSMTSSFMRQNLDPIYYGDFSMAVTKLESAVDRGEDLNVASIDLMDFTADFFYSLTWSFFENAEDAKNALENHMIEVEEDLTKSLLKDNVL